MEIVEATSLNIAILPGPGIKDLAIGLSQKVAKGFQTEFVLDEQKFMPHATVYQSHFPVRNIEKIKGQIKEVMEGQHPFTVKMEGFSVVLDTFLFWDLEKSESLQRLQNNIVARINHLREGLILPHLATVSGMTEEDISDINMYGSMFVGPSFSPHITITRLSDPKDAESVMKSLGGLNYKAMFEVDGLILGYLGPNGTVNGIIETFKFGR